MLYPLLENSVEIRLKTPGISSTSIAIICLFSLSVFSMAVSNTVQYGLRGPFFRKIHHNVLTIVVGIDASAGKIGGYTPARYVVKMLLYPMSDGRIWRYSPD
jgi:hypothetical protein